MDERMVEFPKWSTAWKIIFEPMARNVVISEADAFMYVALCKPEKHVRYMELVGTTECLTLYTKCRRNSVRYNWVRLHFVARGDT